MAYHGDSKDKTTPGSVSAGPEPQEFWEQCNKDDAEAYLDNQGDVVPVRRVPTARLDAEGIGLLKMARDFTTVQVIALPVFKRMYGIEESENVYEVVTNRIDAYLARVQSEPSESYWFGKYTALAARTESEPDEQGLLEITERKLKRAESELADCKRRLAEVEACIKTQKNNLITKQQNNDDLARKWNYQLERARTLESELAALRTAPAAPQPPTIEELQAILDDPTPMVVRQNPDGSIRAELAPQPAADAVERLRNAHLFINSRGDDDTIKDACKRWFRENPHPDTLRCREALQQRDELVSNSEELMRLLSGQIKERDDVGRVLSNNERVRLIIMAWQQLRRELEETKNIAFEKVTAFRDEVRSLRNSQPQPEAVEAARKAVTEISAAVMEGDKLIRDKYWMTEKLDTIEAALGRDKP